MVSSGGFYDQGRRSFSKAGPVSFMSFGISVSRCFRYLRIRHHVPIQPPAYQEQDVLPALLDVALDFLGLLPFDADLQLPALKSKSRNLESAPILSANLQS